MKFLITFKDIVEAKNEDEAIEDFIDYIQECARNGDVIAFDFKAIKEAKP